MKESELLTYAIKRCWHERSWLTVDRINCGAVMVADKAGRRRPFRGARNGTSDLVGYFAPLGRYIGLELKVGKNTQSDDQKAFEVDVKAKGGLYFVVRDMQELEDVLSSIKPGAL